MTGSNWSLDTSSTDNWMVEIGFLPKLKSNGLPGERCLARTNVGATTHFHHTWESRSLSEASRSDVFHPTTVFPGGSDFIGIAAPLGQSWPARVVLLLLKTHLTRDCCDDS
jgi:hypothetical protein